MVPCTPTTQATAPVYRVSLHADDEITFAYDSVQRLCETVVAAYHTGGYHVDADGFVHAELRRTAAVLLHDNPQRTV